MKKIPQTGYYVEIDAVSIRDRISSRRAQGQIERALGNRSWHWDT